jgi:predicted AlkP superfamily pyrophosphatase or phosphodiesterase
VPTLKRLAREGVRASMRPAFPSLTFPNHYTLVTGLYPEQHRITENDVNDPTGGNQSLTMNSETPPWWTWVGEPVWVTAERNGLKTATMFWPASNAEIHGYRPSYRHVFDRTFPNEKRVAQVLEWLDLPDPQRPRFITLYFEATDQAGHDYGPFSAPLRTAARTVDDMLRRLLQGLQERQLSGSVNLIVTSDHGMAALSEERIEYLSDVLNLETVSTRGGGPYLFVSARDGNTSALLNRLRRLQHARVYTWDQVPQHLHFRNPPEREHFAILLLADDGWRLARARWLPSATAPSARPSLGAHGYDVAYASMKALFVAHGPRFKRGQRLREFDSVQVHALLLTLLGLEPPRPTDLDTFADVLTAPVLSHK